MVFQLPECDLQSIKSFLSRFPHIYCLSLPKCEDRRSYIKELFACLQVENYSFFDAHDGESEIVINAFNRGSVKTFPPCFRCGKLECGNDDCNNTLISSQVATFYSYIELLKTFLNSPHQFALFVEDDIKLALLRNSMELNQEVTI